MPDTPLGAVTTTASFAGDEACVEIVTTGDDPDGMAEWIGSWKPERFELAKVKKRFDR